VTVYTKPACPQCNATKLHLDKLGVAYTVEEITPEVLAAAAELDVLQAPIVCASINGAETWWGGYRPDAIKALVSAA